MGDIDYIMSIVSYITETTEIDVKTVVETIKDRLPTVTEERIMTLAQRWEHEGYKKGLTLAEQWKQEGMQKGVQLGRQETLKAVATASKLLSQGRNIDEVVTLTGLSASELDQLKMLLIINR